MKSTLAACLIAVALVTARPAPAEGTGRPPEVLPLRMAYPTTTTYAELRDQWLRYANAHPRDVRAWTQLARAAYYAQSCESAKAYAKKALEIDPNDAEALAALGRYSWALYCGGPGHDDPSESIRLLERALALDPLVDDAHYHLWTMRLSQGKRDEANAHLKSLLDNGRMPEPLVDFGYNLLVGLEPRAILVTNGDNDTYPCLALQTARGLRTDVIVVNVGLLALPWYRAQLAAAPASLPLPLGEREDCRYGTDVVKMLLENLERRPAAERRPVYFAVTLDAATKLTDRQLACEGVVYRVRESKGDAMADEAKLARNLEGLYRRESATSASVDWKRWTALGTLMRNYVAADYQLALALYRRHADTRGREVMERVLDSCDRQHESDGGAQFLAAWEQVDPRAPRLAYWRKRFPRP